jgi:hypothetical protein
VISLKVSRRASRAALAVADKLSLSSPSFFCFLSLSRDVDRVSKFTCMAIHIKGVSTVKAQNFHGRVDLAILHGFDPSDPWAHESDLSPITFKLTEAFMDPFDVRPDSFLACADDEGNLDPEKVMQYHDRLDDEREAEREAKSRKPGGTGEGGGCAGAHARVRAGGIPGMPV